MIRELLCSLFTSKVTRVLSLVLLAATLHYHWSASPSPSLQSTLLHLASSPPSLAILVNATIALLYTSASIAKSLFLSGFSRAEQDKWADRLVNFAFGKALFFGAVLAPDLSELLVWSLWFSLLALERLLVAAARDRHRLLVSTAAPLARPARRLATLLVLVSLVNAAWASLALTLFAEAGPSVLALMLFEPFVVFVEATQALLVLAASVRDARALDLVTVAPHAASFLDPASDDSQIAARVEAAARLPRSRVGYYAELVGDTAVHAASLLHNLHILWVHGLGLTFVDLVIGVRARSAYVRLKGRVESHRTYVRLTNDLEHRFPPVSSFAGRDDTCAICLGTMDAWTPERAPTLPPSQAPLGLPCKHAFHRDCLLGWLETQTSCPTCRGTLTVGRSRSGVWPADAQRADRSPTGTPPTARRGAREATTATPQEQQVQQVQQHQLGADGEAEAPPRPRAAGEVHLSSDDEAAGDSLFPHLPVGVARELAALRTAAAAPGTHIPSIDVATNAFGAVLTGDMHGERDRGDEDEGDAVVPDGPGVVRRRRPVRLEVVDAGVDADDEREDDASAGTWTVEAGEPAALGGPLPPPPPMLAPPPAGPPLLSLSTVSLFGSWLPRLSLQVRHVPLGGVAALQEVFPRLTEADATRVLAEVGGDVDAAVGRLLDERQEDVAGAEGVVVVE